MEAKDIKSIEDAQRYVEGCLNDFEAGISTKEETMVYFFRYTQRLHALFWSTAKIKIKNNPQLLNEPNI